MNNEIKEKERFILDEIFMLSQMGGFARNLVYKDKNVKDEDRISLKKFIKSELEKLINNYKTEVSKK